MDMCGNGRGDPLHNMKNIVASYKKFFSQTFLPKITENAKYI
jgi:hypothetical protein